MSGVPQIAAHQLDRNIDCELVIGLVAAVGTELELVSNMLTEQMQLAGYETELIKISDDVIPLVTNVDSWSSKYDRYKSLMDAGNRARKKAWEQESSQGVSLTDRRGNAVLAYGCASKIFLKRQTLEGKPQPNGRKAFILRSLKRPEEVEALRLIYPHGFVLIGVHAEDTRKQFHLTNTLGMEPHEARDLMERDADETKDPHGQLVNKTFHLADFFVHASSDNDKLRCDIARMVELWFGHKFHTPTFDEYAMYFAFSAALRSADLSRQVGAVVTKDNQILSTGANDCPRAGGGLYWPDRHGGSSCISDEPRGRDYLRGHDSNKAEQIEMLKHIRTIIEGCVTSRLKPHEEQLLALFGGSDLMQCLDLDSIMNAIGKGRIRDLTEFGRVVHAEMEALLSCGRVGHSTVGTTLYCTTFPCHNCAKHIIAAGVDRVVYIEPYPKSKALNFHDEAIVWSINRSTSDKRVWFQPFVGIGPRRYFDLFSMNLGSSYDLVRKNSETGERLNWRFRDTRLRVPIRPSSYLDLETEASKYFEQFQG